MDSPENAKITTTVCSTPGIPATTSSASPVQESPFTNYVSSLSPIVLAKAPHVAERFLGLNSPPLVFTSPRINTHHERTLLRSAEVCDGGEENRDGSSGTKRSITELQEELITDVKEDGETKSLVQVQSSSSSSLCPDEYLADPIEVDCASSLHSVDLNLKKADVVLQSSVDLTDLQKIVSNVDSKNNIGTGGCAALALCQKSGGDLSKKSTFDIKQGQVQQKQNADEGSSNKCPKLETDFSNLASKKQQCGNSDAQVGDDPGDEFDGSPQLLPGSSQSFQAYEDFSEEPADSMTCDPEGSQHQRGMSRRCLQFGEPKPTSVAKCKFSSNVANDMTTSGPLSTAPEIGNFGSFHVDSNATSRKNQPFNLPQSKQAMFSCRYDGKSSLAVPKPTGIGLHLNSIVSGSGTSMGHGGTSSRELAVTSMDIQGLEPRLTAACHSLENIKGYSSTVEKASACLKDGMLDTKDSVVAGPATSDLFCAMDSIEHQATVHTKRSLESEHQNSYEDSNQQRPKKKRKKGSNTVHDEGYKQCNCKKSKCLKLYCDCFAAGIYCAESCACQGCFNRPEYEATVLDTRQQIESRDPLAFAPRVIQRANEFPVGSGEDGNWRTPSSARHKRGCSCKKSMCLKKYCECFQAKVGCSLGCRCEGCQNTYGRREDYGLTEEMGSSRASADIFEGKCEQKLEIVATKEDFLCSDLCHPHDLTPMTPSFQCSVSPRNPDSNDMVLERSKQICYVNSDGQGTDYDKDDVLVDARNLSPLPDDPSVIMSSSASSKARDCKNVSQPQLTLGSGGLTRLASGGSLRWRSSPITPISRLGGSKYLQDLDSEGGLYNILEDDTPEILQNTSTSTKSVQVSSPNSKRVSPPHEVHGFGSSSSGPLRSGRKFILKAVPSFPPLTPCIDLKSSSNHKRSNFQEDSSNG